MNDPTFDPTTICAAAQLVLLSPPRFEFNGYTCYVAGRPAEATLRRRLKEAGAVLVRYGTDCTTDPPREYVRFLIDGRTA